MEFFRVFPIVMYAIAIPFHVLVFVAIIRGIIKHNKGNHEEDGGEQHDQQMGIHK